MKKVIYLLTSVFIVGSLVVIFVAGRLSKFSSFHPTQASPSPSSFQLNDQLINQAILSFLSSHPLLNLNDNQEKIFCASHIYGWNQESNSNFRVYTWIYCQSYNSQLKEGSATSEPVLFHLSFKNNHLTVTSLKRAKNGDQYVPSIKQMFPQKFATQAIDGQPNVVNLVKSVKRQAESYYHTQHK